MMETLMDKVVAELKEFRDADSSAGGIADIVTVEAVFWGDPVVVSVANYPCFVVEPVSGPANAGGTIGRSGLDFNEMSVMVSYLIDYREFFEADPEETSGTRNLVKVGDALHAWMRKSANLLLDDMPGVRSVAVSGVQYIPQPRDMVFAKSAVLTLTVNQGRRRD